MAIKIGSNSVNKKLIGGNEILKTYLGSTPIDHNITEAASSITGVNLLPGSGEYIYNTSVVTKTFVGAVPKVIGFFPNYRPTTVLSAGIDWTKLTELNVFGAVPQADGSIAISDPTHFTTSVAQAAANTTDVTLAIGGYTESLHFPTIAASLALCQAFAQNCLTLCTTHSLKGINIDWEFPDATKKADTLRLFQELYSVLNTAGYILTADINGSDWGIGVWDSSILSNIDFAYVMTYDDQSDPSGNHSSLAGMVNALNNVVNLGVPKNKILGGVPFYSRGAAVETYKQILDGATDKSAIYNNSVYEGKYYNGKNIITQKGSYIQENGFAGLIVWELGQDSYDEYALLPLVHSALSDRSQDVNNTTNTNVADAIVSLDKMQSEYDNLESISVIVVWYGDTDDDTMNITPRIDRHDASTTFNAVWNVGSYTRANTAESSLTAEGLSNVGGTPGDLGLVEFVTECGVRGIKVMLYPFLQTDTLAKGWRGDIAHDGTQVSLDAWFVKYTAFIRHYSVLFGGTGLIDTFMIGSELKSLTQLKISGLYEGVNKLVTLAGQVKTDFGVDATNISYGANWDEYHSHEGVYNMDALWTSSSIDMIGVDNYFPLTDFQDPATITYQNIYDGFESGEGWDHYYTVYNDETSKVNYAVAGGEWSWKNIFGWWDRTHTGTTWTARMKPLFFAEYGFASVDGTTNQPNVFTPSLPRESTGTTSFEIQRKAVLAFNSYWDAKTVGVTGFAEDRYAWAYDIRPYPYFPLSYIWEDSDKWEQGHWINGKIQD